MHPSYTFDPSLIPVEVSRTAYLLAQAGFESYLVGGCVRDLLLHRPAHDWDITTNAQPEEIIAVYEAAGKRVVYENTFGTVAIVDESVSHDSPLRTIEITPYRTETSYSDHRHPDEVCFTRSLTEDLQRRDFTVNAMALSFTNGELVDPYGGQADLEKKVLRAVGDPAVRFSEDALRLMRGVRLATQLGFSLEAATLHAMQDQSSLLEHISKERIRDEFIKLIMTPAPLDGLMLLRDTGMLTFISPELLECVGVDQSRNHIYDVWEHCARACDTAARESWSLPIRIAALFHDVGKPRTRRWDKKQHIFTFYGHEVVGARMVEEFMERLKFPTHLRETVVKLVRYHMFFSDTEKITLSAVRRMIRNVGREHIWDLMKVRRSDRIGMGRAKADPYRLRMYESMIEEALRDPIDVSMLALDGEVLMHECGMKPGRAMGWILNILLEEVIEDPTRNTRELLVQRVAELQNYDEKKLAALGKQGREAGQKADEAVVQKLRSKHGVRFEK